MKPKKPYSRLQRNILDKTGWRCVVCGEKIRRKEFTKEHLLPKSRGGNSHFNNLWACHYDCNQEKGAMTLEEYTYRCMEERRLLEIKCKLTQKEK